MPQFIILEAYASGTIPTGSDHFCHFISKIPQEILIIKIGQSLFSSVESEYLNGIFGDKII